MNSLVIIYIITIVLVFGFGVFTYIKNSNTSILEHLAMTAVIEAEKYLGSKTGRYKFNYALSYVYDKLPLIVKTFISKDKIAKFIEDKASDLDKFIKSGGDISDYATKELV